MLFASTRKVSGTTTFTPEPGGAYIVTGELGAKHSSVWIEDALTHERVGQKIEN